MKLIALAVATLASIATAAPQADGCVPGDVRCASSGDSIATSDKNGKWTVTHHQTLYITIHCI